jgi:RNA polymerase sigma-70 factor (ECF subfamily)
MAMDWTATVPDRVTGGPVWRAVRLALASLARDPAQPADRADGGAGSIPGEDAFEAFFWRFERQIFSYLWRMTGEEQSAFDLAQETFLRAWQHFGEISTFRDAGPWLFRVATNLALTHLRRRSARRAVPLTEDEPGASDPGRAVAERDAVRRVLAILTPKQRAALVLHEVYGLSCEEVGQALGLSRDAVKMALSRGRESFRAHYLQGEER